MRLVFLALAATALLGVLISGCGQASSPTSDSTATSSASKAAPQVEPVSFTNEKGEILCPVTGDVIADRSKAVGHQDFEGKRYYFCCAGCPETFAKNPGKYAEGKAIASGETGHA